MPGPLLIWLGAFVWASYSVASRRFAAVPSESLCVTMLVCAGLAFACHGAFETTLWTPTPTEWIGVFGLGLGSIGLAFVVWDIGMKQGDLIMGVSNTGRSSQVFMSVIGAVTTAGACVGTAGSTNATITSTH